jgi:two-component system, NtrC family, sensor kinase
MNPRKSIRIKLIQAIVLNMIIIMFFFSVLIMKNQKQNILDKYNSMVIATAETASISIVESFLYSDENSYVSDDLLQSYIGHIFEPNPNIKFAIILNKEGKVRAHSHIEEYGKIYDDYYSQSSLSVDGVQTHIYKTNDNWILEACIPLKISTKSWGSLRIGFDGKPIRKEIAKLFWSVYLLSVGAIIAVIISVWFIISRIIIKLTDTVKILDKIDLTSSHITQFTKSDDEIGMLNEKFQQMHHRLLESVDKLKETNNNLLHTEKLAALGRLASGVAHEINNPLLGMKNCIYLIRGDISNKENIDSNLSLIDESLTRIETIVNQLLGVARKSGNSKENFSINQLITKVIDLLDYRIRSRNIKIELDLDQKLPTYFGSSQLLEEAILNISLNAIDALNIDNPVYKIKSYIIGNEIILEFTDNGCGIPDDIKSKIFEPFYTTKDVGRGTGLGLYVTEETIVNLGGLIEIKDNTGETTFIIKLPRTK